MNGVRYSDGIGLKEEFSLVLALQNLERCIMDDVINPRSSLYTNEYNYQAFEKNTLKNILIYLFPILVSVPIFLVGSGGSIKLAKAGYHETPGAQAFPVSVIAVAVIVLVWTLKRMVNDELSLKSSFINKLIAVFIFFNLISLLFGFVVSDFNIYNLLFFFQRIGPLFAFLIGLNLIDDTKQAKKVIYTIIFAVSLTILSIRIQDLIGYGIDYIIANRPGTHVWIFELYQIWNYYGLIAAIPFILSLAILLSESNISNGMKIWLLPAIVISCIMLASLNRGGVGVAGVGICALIILTKGIPAFRKVVILAFLAAIVILIFHYSNPVVGEAFEGKGIDRPILWRGIYRRGIHDNPIFGLAFVAKGGELGRGHNQYLDIWGTSGLFPLIVFLVIIGASLKHNFILSRTAENGQIRALSIGIFAVILGTALLSANVRDCFVQPYSGNLLWFLMGVGEALYCQNFGWI